MEPLAAGDGHAALGLLDRLLREPALRSADGDPFGGIAPRVQDRLRAAAVADFAALWEHVEREANARAHAAERLLSARGEKEAADLRRLLEAQRAAIGETLGERSQMPLDFGEMEKLQRDQYERDKRSMEGRLAALVREIETEPAQLQALYRVVRPRLEPVGMVYLWPEVRG